MPAGSNDRIRVAIADDEKFLRGVLEDVLAEDDHFEVIPGTGDGLEAVELAKEHRPDVLVLDIRLPGISGLEAAKRVAVESPSTKVVVMSMYDMEAYVYEALKSGARGYVIKQSADKIAEAIATVSGGEIYLTPPLTLDTVDSFRRQVGWPPLNL